MDWDPALDCEIQDHHLEAIENNEKEKESSPRADSTIEVARVETLNVGRVDGAALLCAVRGQHFAIARHLLQAQASVNTTDLKGVTPLMIAATCGNRALTMLMLEHAADVTAQTSTGKDALKMATQHRHMPVVRLLLESGAPVENADGTSDRTGIAPLLKTSQSNHKEVVKLLKSHRAQPNTSESDKTRRLRVKNVPLVVGQRQPPQCTQEMPVFHGTPAWGGQTILSSKEGNSDGMNSTTDSGSGSKTESSEAEPQKQQNRQRWVDMADNLQDFGTADDMESNPKDLGINELLQECSLDEGNNAEKMDTASSEQLRTNQKKRRHRHRHAGYPAVDWQ